MGFLFKSKPAPRPVAPPPPPPVVKPPSEDPPQVVAAREKEEEAKKKIAKRSGRVPGQVTPAGGLLTAAPVNRPMLKTTLGGTT